MKYTEGKDMSHYSYHIYGAMEELGDKWYLHSVEHFEELEDKIKWYNLMWRHVTYTTTKEDLHEGK